MVKNSEKFRKEGREDFEGKKESCPKIPSLPEKAHLKFGHEELDTFFNEEFQTGFDEEKERFVNSPICLKEISDLDLRRRMLQEKMQMMEDEILPFGFTNTLEDDSFVDDEGQVWFHVNP